MTSDGLKSDTRESQAPRDTVSAPGAAEDLASLEARLGYRFRDRSLLTTALQHASYAHEVPGTESNERLEFLGDAVIGVVVATLLYEAKPGWQEGDLTRALHQLVDWRSLSQQARALDCGPHLRLGRTEQQSQGHEKDSILANAMEAIVGAIYLDGGLAPVTDLAGRLFSDALRSDAPRVGRDPKTQLQERIVADTGEFPTYELVSDNELEGDEERFTVRVLVGGEERAAGVGRTKRAAERAAAERALAEMALRSEPE